MPPERAAALLGVPVTAPPAEVQRAFLRAARRTHPDTLPATADAATRRAASEAFDELVRAREVLLAHVPHVATAPGVRATAAAPVPAPARERGIGGSLVVLALLAFLLVGLVSLQDAFRSESVLGPVPARTP